MGFVAAAAVAAGAYALGSSKKSKSPPPVITNASESQQIANKMPPINFASVFDALSGDRLDLRRGPDGKIALAFGNSSGRIDLEEPIRAGNVNTNLPMVRQIRGRNIDERAVGVVLLSQALTSLNAEIELTEKTSPYLIEQNQDLINSFRTASQAALDRGFDFRQNAIDQKLAKMGLGNSSTAFGVQVALAREKANAYADLELKQSELAQGLKQQAITNLHSRGDSIVKNAAIEQNKFNAETANQLQLRGQDMQADLATQEQEQRRAAAQVAFDLQNDQQRIGVDLANKQLAEGRRNRMVQAGVNLFNSGNDQAIGARQVENTGIHNANLAQYHRHSLMRNPWQEAMNVGVGAFAGSLGTIGAAKLTGVPITASDLAEEERKSKQSRFYER